MAIKFPVAVGTVLLCDYRGFKEPEMVKRRPVVVISPRLPHRHGLCTVVPLGQREPLHPVTYQCRIEFARPLPHPFPASVFWAKADMLATVGFHRLDLFHTERDRQTGRRKYVHPKVSPGDLARIMECVRRAIGA